MSGYGQYTPGSGWARLERVWRKKIHHKTREQYVTVHNKLELHSLTKKQLKGDAVTDFRE